MMLEEFLGKLSSWVVAPAFSEINSPSALKEGFVYLQCEYSKPRNGLLQPDFDFIAPTFLSELYTILSQIDLPVVTVLFILCLLAWSCSSKHSNFYEVYIQILMAAVRECLLIWMMEVESVIEGVYCGLGLFKDLLSSSKLNICRLYLKASHFLYETPLAQQTTEMRINENWIMSYTVLEQGISWRKEPKFCYLCLDCT